MKQTINSCDFIDAFRAHGRQNQFSYAGLRALFEYLEEMEDGMGEEMELDVIALCCDYSEFASAKEAATEHGMPAEDDKDEQDEDAIEEHALQWLQDRTSVIPHDSGIIIQSF